MSLPHEVTYGPPDEVSVIDDIQTRQFYYRERPDYLEAYNPYESGVRSLDELPDHHSVLLLRVCQRAEDRFQGIKPDGNGYYFDRHTSFVNHMLSIPENDILDTEHVLVVGPRDCADEVLLYILARRADIVRISGKEPEKFALFLGSGEIMGERYRSIGSSRPPYAYALTGALDCYLNTDYYEPSGAICNPSTLRAAWHEPAHIMWNSVLGKDLAQSDIIAHELLAGPLDPKFWADIRLPWQTVDAYPLLDGDISYQEWYARNSQGAGCLVQYFDKPMIKELILRAKDIGYAALYNYAMSGDDYDVRGRLSRYDAVVTVEEVENFRYP